MNGMCPRETFRSGHKKGKMIMNIQKYSVLMSVYMRDNPAYVADAVESMLHQTMPPEEYVIVVDGLIPKELNRTISDYEKQKELFTIIRLNENKGLGNALNVGLAHCRNELVARMDADDISLPQRCEKELKLFEECPELVICGCNINEFCGTPDNVKTSRVVPQSYEEIRKFMRRRQPFNHPTVIYKKSKVLGCGGYKTLTRKEDFDLFSRMLSDGCLAKNIGEPLYLYRANEDNYARRKSWQNFRSAIYVYGLHLKRKGCSLIDYLIVCNAELLFILLPRRLMKILSDKVLRKGVISQKWHYDLYGK